MPTTISCADRVPEAIDNKGLIFSRAVNNNRSTTSGKHNQAVLLAGNSKGTCTSRVLRAASNRLALFSISQRVTPAISICASAASLSSRALLAHCAALSKAASSRSLRLISEQDSKYSVGGSGGFKQASGQLRKAY